VAAVVVEMESSCTQYIQ